MTPYKKAGWATIASGILGLLSFVALITAVTTRDTLLRSTKVLMFFRLHDAGVIIQYGLLLPAVFALYHAASQNPPGISKRFRNTGVATILSTMLFLLLIFPNLMADILYMFPQGIFGIWLIALNWKLKGTLPAALRWFGIIVGTGLALVGVFPAGYAIFVDPILVHIPAPPPEVIENTPVNTPANIFLHQLLNIGSFMGVLTLPFWTVLLGITLARKK